MGVVVLLEVVVVELQFVYIAGTMNHLYMYMVRPMLSFLSLFHCDCGLILSFAHNMIINLIPITHWTAFFLLSSPETKM